MPEDKNVDNYRNEKQDLEKADEANMADDMDHSKVKFINGGAGDAQVDMSQSESSEVSFSGMTKDELLKYADDPFWVKMRYALFILFWLAWIGMLIAAILIIVFAPKCPPRQNLDWWQKGAAYQVYPKSFKDSNGDGVGDLKGVAQKVGYLKAINATIVHMKPVYASPMTDGGYDITNHTEINTVFGNMEDFKSLVQALHSNGMRLIMDFVPNHTSKKHPWFQASRKDKTNAYADFYIWSDDKPNNWLNVFGEPAWTLDPERNQYYFHQFSSDQPDLNLRHEKVLEELEEIIRFWLTNGVDGLSVVAANQLYESPDLTKNEPPSATSDDKGYWSLNHTLTTNQPETFELLARWRSIMDEFTGEGKYRVLLAEVYGTPQEVAGYYYGTNMTRGADMPLNYNLIDIDAKCGGNCIYQLVNNWVKNAPDGKWNNWMVSSQDKSRVASRKGRQFTEAINMLTLTLPGTPFIYYGDEIGMTDTVSQSPVPPVTRDASRGPMQWTSGKLAGFTEGNTTWLPVADNYKEVNVETLTSHGSGRSELAVFTDLTLLRQEPSFQWGKFDYGLVDENIFSYVRQAEGFPGYLVILNVGNEGSTFSLKRHLPDWVPGTGAVQMTTEGFSHTDFEAGNTMDFSKSFYVASGQGIIFTFPWTPPQ